MITSISKGAHGMWSVVQDSDGEPLAVFPSRVRAEWYRDQCAAFADGEPGIDSCIYDVDIGRARWVHEDKREPADVEALQVRLAYAEKILAGVAAISTPRVWEGSRQDKLDAAHGAAKAYVKKYGAKA